MPARRLFGMTFILLGLLFASLAPSSAQDRLRDLQTKAIQEKRSAVAHWGVDPAVYVGWSTHSNRLIPVYTFGTRQAPEGARLADYMGAHSLYRSPEKVAKLYGRLPENTIDPAAEFLDQTNVFDIQKAAFDSGRKKYIFLVVFDGMDWQTTRAAAIYSARQVAYSDGRGRGLHFQEYTAGDTTEFGFMVTSPHNTGTKVDADLQTVINPGGTMFGGYNIGQGGAFPWQPGDDVNYLISKGVLKHAYTDSSCSASSMTAGIKSFNGAVNVDFEGHPVPTIAHMAQDEGWSVGAVTSVPISHATPAAAYAHNVERDDYQDLTRDMLGLPSIQHPSQPLRGMDVVIAGGYGVTKKELKTQGKNFVPGQVFLTDDDLRQVDVRNGGQYTVAVRSSGFNGADVLRNATDASIQQKTRLLGFFGLGAYGGHLPFATADGDYRPAPGKSGKAEEYTRADINENPTLAQMTHAAIDRLAQNPKGFWLMVESGDVDWANHDNNLDNSIGAVRSGDRAIKVITDWVERHSNWDESLMIVTADHGHYLFIDQPEALMP